MYLLWSWLTFLKFDFSLYIQVSLKVLGPLFSLGFLAPSYNLPLSQGLLNYTYLKFSCLQTTPPSTMSQLSSHTPRHSPLWYISTFPRSVLSSSAPLSIIVPSGSSEAKTNRIRREKLTTILVDGSFLIQWNLPKLNNKGTKKKLISTGIRVGEVEHG